MCTNVAIRDTSGRTYQGRTMELGFAMDFDLAYYPVNSALASRAPPGWQALQYQSLHPFLSIDGAQRGPETPSSCAGVNGAGLSVNMNMFKESNLQAPKDPSRPVLSVADLGTWLLARCSTCAEVREALAEQDLWLETRPQAAEPAFQAALFHYAVFDTQGQGLVVEFDQGVVKVYDNPVGVMTNGPAFAWHLTNLDNYAFAHNVGKREQHFGSHLAQTEDVGNAMVGLPVDDTSSARFVRAAYYAQFCRQTTHPDEALAMMAQIINKFDRPRGATNLGQPFEEEWTLFTTLSDLSRRTLHVRTDRTLNYLRFDLDDFLHFEAIRRQSLATLIQQHSGPAPVLF